MIIRTFSTNVGPAPVQDPNPELTIGPFPYYRGCRVSIVASGDIGSGVVFTCRTAPGGWPDWVVGPDETDWPCRDGRATRYGLIGRLNDEPYFFVGGEIVKFSLEPRAEPPQTAILRLAVNRPHPEGRSAGDGGWHVEVTAYEPDPGELPSVLCSLVQESIRERRAAAPMLCTQIERSIHAIDDRWTQVLVAGQVAGVALIALISVALPVLIPQTAATAAATQGTIRTAQNVLNSLIRPVSPGGPIGAAFASAVAAAVTIPVTQATTTAATAAGAANASPVGLTPFGRIVIIALTIVLVAAVAVLVGLLLSQIQLAANNANARANWNSMLNGLREDLRLARETCEGMIDDALPTCAALGG